MGIIAGTVAVPLGAAFVLASLLVSIGASFRRALVPGSWRVMAVLSPLFAVGGVAIALLHATASDPLSEVEVALV